MKNDARLQLRLPSDVHQWIADFAEQNDRSMNGQIIALIKEKMQERKAGNVPQSECLPA